MENLLSSTNYDPEAKIWCGPIEEEHYAKDLSIGAIIYEELRRHPDDIAQISATEHTVLTKGEMLENAVKIATFLRNAGVKQNDIVGIIGRNTTHMAALGYACFFNGTAFHALNPNYEESTIQQLFSITEPKIIFCDGEDYEKVKLATKSLAGITVYTMRNHTEGSPTILDILQTPFEKQFRPAKLEHGIDKTLAILCSSGTTGIPKAVTVSNSRKIFQSSSFLNSSDVQLSISSLDWITGLITLITTAVYGSKRIVLDQPYDPVKFLQIIDEYQVTWILQAPAHLAMLVNCKELTAEKMDSLRYYIYGGGRCTLQTLEKLQTFLRNGGIYSIYGFTELGIFVSLNSFSQNPNSSGLLMSNFKAKIVNEDGIELGRDEKGEICVYHDQHWSGYYKNDAETIKMQKADGWFHSGDLGYFDKDNFLYIVDRKKEMLKYQNIMYYPNEVEDVIARMPEVTEVCVFGIWNQLEGDLAAAVVTKHINAQLTAQDVIDYVAKNVSAVYKHLHGGALLVEDLKRSANGKINRNENKTHFLDVKNGN